MKFFSLWNFDFFRERLNTSQSNLTKEDEFGIPYYLKMTPKKFHEDNYSAFFLKSQTIPIIILLAMYIMARVVKFQYKR
jgi:hypothetical protein